MILHQTQYLYSEKVTVPGTNESTGLFHALLIWLISPSKTAFFASWNHAFSCLKLPFLIVCLIVKTFSACTANKCLGRVKCTFCVLFNFLDLPLKPIKKSIKTQFLTNEYTQSTQTCLLQTCALFILLLSPFAQRIIVVRKGDDRYGLEGWWMRREISFKQYFNQSYLSVIYAF